MGTVNPLAQSVNETWDKLVRGESGIGRITLFDPEKEKIPISIAGEVKEFDPGTWGMTTKDTHRFDRVTQFTVAAAKQAIVQANLEGLSDGERERAAVVIGTGIGGFGTSMEQEGRRRDKGVHRVSPFTVPRLMPNAPANVVSMRWKFTGASFAVTTACAAGTDAIGRGYNLILSGEADLVIAGGSEAPITPLTLAAFGNMQALSRRDVHPTLASCPFDRDRDGFVIAEGATVLVLETETRARLRGAAILGYISGYGSTTDAYDLVKPREDGRQAARAVRRALHQARADRYTIGYINAHGTSTPINDLVETLVIRNVFGKEVEHILVSSTKSMTGHQLGAGGAFEAMVCVEALRRKVAPPTINLMNQDSECTLNHIVGGPRELAAYRRFALSNSFAFGGSNAALVFESV